MTNFAHGRAAEAAAATYLKHEGFEVLEQNYRNRYCEIDIVAAKDQIIYFVEVKYRETNAQGGGLDYITPRKQQQMAFAAELWLQDHGPDSDYRLSAVEVSGTDYDVTEFLDEL